MYSIAANVSDSVRLSLRVASLAELLLMLAATGTVLLKQQL